MACPTMSASNAVALGGWVVELKELMTILELHRQGLSVSAIAERTGKARRTVRKYIARGLEVPRYLATNEG